MYFNKRNKKKYKIKFKIKEKNISYKIIKIIRNIKLQKISKDKRT